MGNWNQFNYLISDNLNLILPLRKTKISPVIIIFKPIGFPIQWLRLTSSLRTKGHFCSFHTVLEIRYISSLLTFVLRLFLLVSLSLVASQRKQIELTSSSNFEFESLFLAHPYPLCNFVLQLLLKLRSCWTFNLQFCLKYVKYLEKNWWSTIKTKTFVIYYWCSSIKVISHEYKIFFDLHFFLILHITRKYCLSFKCAELDNKS